MAYTHNHFNNPLNSFGETTTSRINYPQPTASQPSGQQYSGPYVKAFGILNQYPTNTFDIHISLSSISMFFNHKDALRLIRDGHVRLLLESKIKSINTIDPSRPLWCGLMDSKLNLANDMVFIYPTENKDVYKYHKGGPLAEIAEMIRFSPLLGGEIDVAKMDYEKHV